jgi:hypothetical protein
MSDAILFLCFSILLDSEGHIQLTGKHQQVVCHVNKGFIKMHPCNEYIMPGKQQYNVGAVVMSFFHVFRLWIVQRFCL